MYQEQLCYVCVHIAAQGKDGACVCSERHECLWCLERTAAHTLLSFSNTDNIQHASSAVSSRARLEPNGVHCHEVENPGATFQTKVPLTSPVTDTDVDVSSQSSCDCAVAADDSGMTPQMKSSRLAQVSGCNLKMRVQSEYVTKYSCRAINSFNRRIIFLVAH